MKKIIFTIGFLLSVFTSFSQVPESFSYQAVARDDSGNPIADTQVSIKISILQGSLTGSSVYTETHVPTTNQFGLINLQIGQGTTSDNFNTINWSTGQFFLKIEMDETGGNAFKSMGTSQLLSVPFALYAANAPASFNLNYPDGFDNVENITQEINATESYTVPDGKNLYIQAAQRGLKIDNNAFESAYHPLMIAGPNKIISGISDGGFISGFLVDATVTAINMDLSTGDYIVPVGKIFVLYSVSDTDSFLLDGTNINPNGSSDWDYPPLIITPGKVLSGNTIINGYLK